MEINFFTVWFFVSPFIILHLYLKNKEYKEKANIVIEKINEVWDKEYKDIIVNYGSTANFLECHKNDFDSMRNGIVNFYRMASCANREYFVETEHLLEYIEDDKIDREEIYKTIKLIRRHSMKLYNDLLSQVAKFVIDEEKVHNNTCDCEEIIKDIDEKYKN